MNLSFTQIINAIEAEIKSEYIGFAIEWADKNCDGAWSNAINRFDKSLVIAVERMDYVLAKNEGEFYKETVLGLIRQYKAAKGIDDTKSFLLSIGKEQDEKVH